MNPRWVPILCYHRVCEDHEVGSDSRSLCVSPKQFSRQMAFLKLIGKVPISIQNLVAYLRNQKNIPEKSIVLTFDDGYEDNYRHAFPILKKYGFPSTIFLVTDKIGKTNDWDSGEQPLLKTHQIEEMQSQGVSFGSHSATHIDLTNTEQDKIHSELEQSRKYIEELTARKDIPFCYPYARVSTQSKEQVKKVKYLCGIAGDTGPDNQREDLFELKRIQVFPSTDLFGFWKKIQPWYPWWMKFQKRLKGKSVK